MSAIERVLADASVTTIACWDTRHAPIPWLQLARFTSSLDDVWHPGARLSGDDDDLLPYVLPFWVNRRSPDPSVAGAINWRIDLRACFLRASTVRTLGLDGQFETFAGLACELGLRMIRRGGVCRQQPSLWSGPPMPEPMSVADRYRLVLRAMSRKWQVYALMRSVIDGRSPLRELRGLLASADEKPVTTASGALQRPLSQVTIPSDVSVTVVLPTYGRYPYLAEVLEDLRAQTIRPKQIVICDGNPPEEREPEVYERFRDLPIEVIGDDQNGMCSARNACMQRATGEYIWFVDDDSRFDADNLESHLRVLLAYGADVSVGPAITKGRPELHAEQREVACTFMDCGTTLVKKSLVDAVGGFDLQFNTLLPNEDFDIGVRFVRAGGLMVSNPFAKRFHYLAPVGGCRRVATNPHRWTRFALSPRPVETVYYVARRHFERGVEWDAMLQAGVRRGWQRRDGEQATLEWRVKTLLGEIAALPVTAYRFAQSYRIGKAMFERGPRIPAISPTSPTPGSIARSD